MAIFYRNVGSSPLKSFSVDIREVPFLKYQRRDLGGDEIEVGSQLNEALMMQCIQVTSVLFIHEF